MLVMVVETFRQPEPGPVRARFEAMGRMLPVGVEYLSSWITPDGRTCYQLMEAPDLESLSPWLAAWSDLVEFDLVPVLTAKEFWDRASSSP